MHLNQLWIVTLEDGDQGGEDRGEVRIEITLQIPTQLHQQTKSKKQSLASVYIYHSLKKRAK